MILKYACQYGDIWDIYEWKDWNKSNKICDKTKENGHLDCLKFLHDNGCY